MSDITEEEACALDEFVTKYPPKADPSKARYKDKDRMVVLDDFSADYLMSVSVGTKKTPSEIIGEMIREKISSST